MNKSILLVRLLVALVLISNVQCALVFLIQPAQYAPDYQLSGAVGNAMVQGMGLLFLMWNVPYLLAAIHPVRFRVSLYEALAMQAIGLIGESLILGDLPADLSVLIAGIQRFILFDAGGLVLLLLAFGLLRWSLRSVQQIIQQA